MKAITVYCSASSSLDPCFYESAEIVGRALAERNIDLIYGGGGVGLMGSVAKACKAAGGRAIGIITEHLMNLEQGWSGCDELVVVDTMRERKRLMMERGEGFLILPGGLGTYEEFFEALVARLVEEHRYPIGVLNVEGCFDPLLGLLDHGVKNRFITAPTLALIQFETDPIRLVDALIETERVEIDPDSFYPARSG